MVFNSWDVDFATHTVQDSLGSKQAQLVMYESSTSDVTTPVSGYTYYGGSHYDSFNAVKNYWSISGSHHYGYWGKSKTADGSTPVAGGSIVLDIGVHPPSPSNNYTVMRFIAPYGGTYSVDLFGWRRKNGTCGSESDLGLYLGNVQKAWIEDLPQSNALPTEGSGNTVYSLGALAAGDTINFAVHNSNGYDCDANFVRWRVTAAVTTCDESTWPDKDHGLVCGECKVLVNRFNSAYSSSCANYCQALGKTCVDGWEEKADNCVEKANFGCSAFSDTGTSDAICECSPG